MKPIRLKKDDVAHVVHTAVDRVRLATGASPRTAANPAGHGWPACWVCTEKRIRGRADGDAVAHGDTIWVPVEGYRIADKREGEEDLQAECTHGNPGGRVYVETKVLTMPRTWSETKKRHKRSALVFFTPASGTPIGGNLVLA